MITGITIDYERITLGFDPSMGLYKLIRIYSHAKTYYHCEILEVGISFEGKWKNIGKIPHNVDFDNSVYLNGAIYWKINPWSLSVNKGKTLASYILKLDLKEEKFEMVAPALQNEVCLCGYQVYDWEYRFTLSEEKGMLYMLHYCRKRKYLEGWRLKNNKSDCVWNVVFRVMVEREPHCLLDYPQKPYVVGIVDGKVLMCSVNNDKGVYIYDLAHKKLCKHLDVYCGSAHLDNARRRMLFYCKE